MEKHFSVKLLTNTKAAINAITEHNLSKLKECILQGVSINAKNENGDSLIEIAIFQQHIDIVKFLIAKNADLLACNVAKLIISWQKQQPINLRSNFYIVNPALTFFIIQRAIQQRYIDDEEIENESIVVNKLVTTLLYEANRHGWSSKTCTEIRSYIEYLEPTFVKKPIEYYKSYIFRQETQHNTFYGSYLSDDSDSGEEYEFSQIDQTDRDNYLNDAKVYREHAQINKLTYQRKSGEHKKGDLKEIKHGSTTFDLSARTTIHYDKKIDQIKVTRDLNHLNILIKKGTSIENAISQLQQTDPQYTRFVVAEYRGITYLTTKWNKLSRILHRSDESEIGKPQYSASVMACTNTNIFRDYENAKLQLKNNAIEIHEKAELLQEILLTLREPKPYSYDGYTYSNLGILLQNIYTQDYDGFHHLIKTHPILKHLLLNHANPFFSMGDTPYHAEKYAHGIKPYKGHEDYRLRPRWRNNGKAERPYSGVVYASLHPLTDFTQNGPLHLITLNRAAEIKLKDELEIISERESCFPAYLPAGRVFFKHTAKYPSFQGPYKKIYSYKYGITKDLYDRLKAKLQAARPHTPEMKSFKKLLGEWLCSYHEVKLIDKARQEAEQRGCVLVYRDIDGTFSFQPPIDSVNRNTNAITADIKTPVKAKQAKRSSLSPPATPTIQMVEDETSIDEIIDATSRLNINQTEEVNIFTEGNNSISLVLSLLMNAIKENRHLALKHYLTIEIFSTAVNHKFNTYRLKGATLLHLAVLLGNQLAVSLLLKTFGIDVNATTEETTNEQFHKAIFYENLTPLHLAIIEGHTEIVSLLLSHSNININVCAAVVSNKDLINEAMIDFNVETDEDGNSIAISPDDERYDEDFIGWGWSCRETWPIARTKNLNLFHLAAEQDKPELLTILLNHDKTNSMNLTSSDGETPADRMLDYQKYGLATQMINAGAVLELPNFYLKKIAFGLRNYMQHHTNPQKPNDISSEIFDFLCALKRKRISLLTQEESINHTPMPAYFGNADPGSTREIAYKIFSWFNTQSLSNASATCKNWHKLQSDIKSAMPFKALDEINEDNVKELEVEFNKQLKI